MYVLSLILTLLAGVILPGAAPAAPADSLAPAQTVQSNKYKINRAQDNLFAGGGFGVNTVGLTGQGLGNAGFAMELSFGKWLTPDFGARLVWHGLVNSTKDTEGWFLPRFAKHNHFAFNDFRIDAMWNVRNTFPGYKESYRWDYIPYIGMGILFTEAIDGKYLSNPEYAINTGFLTAFHLTDRIRLTADLGVIATRASAFNLKYMNVRNPFSRMAFFPTLTFGVHYNIGLTGFERGGGFNPDIYTIDAYNSLSDRAAFLERENLLLGDRLSDLRGQNSRLRRLRSGKTYLYQNYEFTEVADTSSLSIGTSRQTRAERVGRTVRAGGIARGMDRAARSESKDTVKTVTGRGQYRINGPFDNVFVGGGIGFNTVGITGQGLGNAGFAAELNFGKWFTPSFGARAVWHGLVNNTKSTEGWFNPRFRQHNHFSFNSLRLDALWNVRNSFQGYDENRLWDIIPYAGAGLLFTETIDGRYFSNPEFALNVGLQNQVHLTKRLNLTADLGLIATRISAFNTKYANANPLSRIAFFPTATVGVQFNIGKTGFERGGGMAIPCTMEEYNAFTEKLAALEKENPELKARFEELEAENAKYRNLQEGQTYLYLDEEFIEVAPDSLFMQVLKESDRWRKSILPYKMQKRWRPKDEPFNYNFLSHLYIGVTGSYYHPFIEDYSSGPFIMLSGGTRFHPAHGVRLDGGVGYIIDNYDTKHLKMGSIHASYLFHLTTFIDGYKKNRMVEVSPLAGVGFSLAKVHQEKLAAGISFHLGVNVATRVFKGTDLFIEPLFEVRKETRNLVRMDLWRRYLMAFRGNVGLQWHIIPADRAKQDKPFFFAAGGGVALQNTMPALTSPGEMLGQSIAVGFGREISNFFDWRLQGMWLRCGWEKARDTGTILRTSYYGLRLDGILDMIDLLARDKDHAFSAAILAGPMMGYMTKPDGDGGAIKYWYTGLGGGLQFKVRLFKKVSVFLEPRATVIPYSAKSWDTGNVNKNYYDGVFSAEAGIEVRL